MSQNTVSEIIDAVCEVGKVDIRMIVGPRQTMWVTKHRQIAMHLARERTAETALSISYQLGRKDHTTVLHADRAIATLREECPDWRKHIEEIVRLLDGTRSQSSVVRCPDVVRHPLAPRCPQAARFSQASNQSSIQPKPEFKKPSSERDDEIKLRVCITTGCERELLSKNYGDRRCKRCKARIRAGGSIDARLESASI